MAIKSSLVVLSVSGAFTPNTVRPSLHDERIITFKQFEVILTNCANRIMRFNLIFFREGFGA